MLENFFEDKFKDFRDDVRSELNSRIFGVIQDAKGDVAEDFFMEAKQTVKKEKRDSLDPADEESRRIAAGDFAMKQDVFGEEVDAVVVNRDKKTRKLYINGHEVKHVNTKGNNSWYKSKKDGTIFLVKNHEHPKIYEEALREDMLDELNKEQIEEIQHDVIQFNVKDKKGKKKVMEAPIHTIHSNGYTVHTKHIAEIPADKFFVPNHAVVARYSEEAPHKMKKVNEDTAEYMIDLHYPDGQIQKEFRIVGISEADAMNRLNLIFGTNKGYKFENLRKNNG